MTGEDLGYKLRITEQAKFDYSPLGKVFKKGLDEEDKKEGLLKSVKIIGDKNDKLLKAIQEKNKKQWKAIENQGKKQLDSNEKNNQLKDDRTKSIALIKDGLEELIKSYPTSFSTFVKNELKHLATKKKNIDHKNCLKIFFLMALVFWKNVAHHTYF